MTPLSKALADRIRSAGPMTLADYMAECLTHPDHGYYTRRDPLGVSGDFTTAPEISQMFGELIGLWVAESWRLSGSPNPVDLVELGPGRGTLMADALRATQMVPGFQAAVSVGLVEVSPTLRTRQAESLPDHAPNWLGSVSELAEDGPPLFLVANEFFDALPIRQFVRSGAGWAERMVTCDTKGTLSLALAPTVPVAHLDHRLDDTQDGDVVELCPAAQSVSETLGHLIARRGGAAIIVDYGGWRSRGDTFQAMRDHASTDPMEAPGEADLTAHVEFEAIANAVNASGARATSMITQGVFLERLGITQRAQMLAQKLSGKSLESHIAAHRRLTHPEEMGDLFKVICITQKGQPVPGFDP